MPECYVNEPDDSDYDHRSHEEAYDPFPRWKRLRAGPALLWTKKHDGYYVASRYHEVCEIARNAEVFSSSINQTMIPTSPMPPMAPIMFDPPEHFSYRIMVNPFFTPAKVREYESWIEPLAHEYIAPLLASNSFNVPTDLGVPMTRAVILRILGIVDAPDEVNRWADDIIFAHRPTAKPAEAIQNVMAYLGAEFEKRRLHPRDDIMTALLDARHKDFVLADEERLSMTMLLLFAGLDTTSFAISGTVMYLLQNPALREELTNANETTWRLAMDEFVRWTSPAPAESRTARIDADVGGCPMRGGDRVMMLFGAANRDEREFSDPDTIILDRFPNRHVGFGIGPHRCLGSHLAKSILHIVLKEMVNDLQHFKITDPEKIEWEAASVRGIRSLALSRIS